MGVEAVSNLLWLVVLTTLMGSAGIFSLAYSEGRRILMRKLVFVLDEQGITRKAKGCPDVKINYFEISDLRESNSWLVVEGREPQKRIAIPKEVMGFEEIRAELSMYHHLSDRAKISLKRIALPVVSILSWAAVLWFQDASVVISAGVVALITLAFGSHRLWSLLHRSSKRPLLWTSLGFAWLAALMLIYIRIVRP